MPCHIQVLFKTFYSTSNRFERQRKNENGFYFLSPEILRTKTGKFNKRS